MAKQNTQQTEAITKPLTGDELRAKIALTGNLAGLSVEARWEYYQQYCDHLGLDPITKPFDLITTYDTGPNGDRIEKTALYPNASCSAQLADKRSITYGKPEFDYNEKLGALFIRVQAIARGGERSTWRSGIAHVDGLKGKYLENAIKKAETQAHRRATLALCGVAMPDESEIEDIQGATTSRFPVVEIPTAEEIFDAPRPVPAPLPAAWTGDTIAREIADQQVANTVGAGLKTISDQIKAEKKEFDHPRDVLQSIANEAPAPDPLPALKPTLTQAQQKVSDAVMSAWKEHKKDKGTVLHLIGQYLQREVKRSSDLTDPEAEKVFSYLQGCMAQWSDEAKNEPIKYDQKNRAHSADLAAELDSLIKKLTILGVKAPDLSNGIASVVMAFSGREVPNRYHLTDEEAKEVIEYLREDLEKKECERAMANDEI